MAEPGEPGEPAPPDALPAVSPLVPASRSAAEFAVCEPDPLAPAPALPAAAPRTKPDRRVPATRAAPVDDPAADDPAALRVTPGGTPPDERNYEITPDRADAGVAEKHDESRTPGSESPAP